MTEKLEDLLLGYYRSGEESVPSCKLLMRICVAALRSRSNPDRAADGRAAVVVVNVLVRPGALAGAGCGVKPLVPLASCSSSSSIASSTSSNVTSSPSASRKVPSSAS